MLGQLWICLHFIEAAGILVAPWWHHRGLLVQADLCTSDILGCAGMQRLPAHQPPWSLPPVRLTPYTPFCLLSSALFNFSGKSFHGVPCHSWLQGRASSQGKLCWKTSLTSAHRVGTLIFLLFTTFVKWWYLTLGCWEQTLPWSYLPQSGHQDPLHGQPKGTNQQ